ncbi:MAG: ParA family protein [Mycoplasmataceae bacterium]|nr:ParA family protein [Mycoplasmataceae bacterium]
MACIISLIGNDIKTGKTTISFNLSILLSKKNKKILLIHQEHTPPYLNPLINQVKTTNKNIISPFVLLEYDKHLSILLFSNGKVNTSKYDYAKLFPKQLELLNSKFDYIIIDTNYVWNFLTSLALANSKKIIGIYDSNNFNASQLQKMLSLVRKNQTNNQNLKLSMFILNSYDPTIHMNSLLDITKMIGDNYLFITLPYREELQKINNQSIKFIKNNKWDDYVLMLNRIVNQILKNV